MYKGQGEKLTIEQARETKLSSAIELLRDISQKVAYEGRQNHAKLAKLAVATHAMHQQAQRTMSLAADVKHIAEHA